MADNRIPTLAGFGFPNFVGFGSPILDLSSGQTGPRNFGYVVGGTIGDFGSFTQLTGTVLGAAFQTRQTPDLAKNVSKGLTPFARGAAFAGNVFGAGYDAVSTYGKVYEQSGSFVTAVDYANRAAQRSVTIGASAWAVGEVVGEGIAVGGEPFLGPIAIPIGAGAGILAGGFTYLGLSIVFDPGI